jgi:hypothetical protein
VPYPEFQAGQRITAALLNAGKMEFVTNSAGAQTSTSTTVANATDLVFAVEANARYWIMAQISYDATADDDDIRFDWEVPSGATMGRNIIGAALSTTTNLDTNAVFIRRGAGTDQEVGGNGGTGSAFMVYQEIVDLVTDSTAGTAQFRFGLGTAAGTATLQADSMIWYQRIA